MRGFGCSCGTDCVSVGAPVPVMMRSPALIGRLICMGITVGRRRRRLAASRG